MSVADKYIEQIKDKKIAFVGMGVANTPCAEFLAKKGVEVYACDKRDKEYIGKEKCDELEALGVWGTWEPCHKEMLGHGIVGVENLGGDLDKVSNKKFQFYCFPLRWYMGDGSMARCVAYIDEDELNDVPDRTYQYCGTGCKDRDIFLNSPFPATEIHGF